VSGVQCAFYHLLLISVGCQQACTPVCRATDNFEATLCDDFADTHDTETHCCGPLMFQCKHCNANFFLAKRLTNSSATNWRFSLCCGDDKVKLWTTSDLPEPLATLLVDTAACCRQFRRYIRCYNSALCLGSLQANALTLPNGPSVFKVQREVYRFIGPMQLCRCMNTLCEYSTSVHANMLYYFCTSI